MTMRPKIPGKAAFDAARSIANFCSTRFPTDTPPCDLLDIPWFAERVQQAIDESTSHMLRKISLLHDATIVLRNGMKVGEWGADAAIQQRAAMSEATRLIEEVSDIS